MMAERQSVRYIMEIVFIFIQSYYIYFCFIPSLLLHKHICEIGGGNELSRAVCQKQLLTFVDWDKSDGQYTNHIPVHHVKGYFRLHPMTIENTLISNILF